MTPKANEGQPVLVVDDEQSIRNALTRYLRHLNFTVVAASDGASALERLAENPDIVLMLSDIRMPGMSGVDLVSQALAANPDLAIVMLTAVEDPSTAIEYMKLGAFDYLIKPIDLDVLRIQIDQALRRRQLETERRELESWLAREVAERTSALEDHMSSLRGLTLEMLVAVVDHFEERAGVTPAGRDVAKAARRIALENGADDETAERIALLAHLAAIRGVPEVEAALAQAEVTPEPEGTAAVVARARQAR